MLNKILKSIVFKRIHYAVEILKTFKHINERTQTTINKYNFAIYHKESLYYMKRTKEENNVIFQLKCERRLR